MHFIYKLNMGLRSICRFTDWQSKAECYKAWSILWIKWGIGHHIQCTLRGFSDFLPSPHLQNRRETQFSSGIWTVHVYGTFSSWPSGFHETHSFFYSKISCAPRTAADRLLECIKPKLTWIIKYVKIVNSQHRILKTNCNVNNNRRMCSVHSLYA